MIARVARLAALAAAMACVGCFRINLVPRHEPGPAVLSASDLATDDDGSPSAVAQALEFGRGASRRSTSELARRFRDGLAAATGDCDDRELDIAPPDPGEEPARSLRDAPREVETTDGAVMPIGADVIGRFAGCDRVRGSVEAHFARDRGRVVIVFQFEDFRLGEGALDGQWVASVDDGGEVTFHGKPNYTAPERPSPEDSAPRRGRRRRKAIGSILFGDSDSVVSRAAPIVDPTAVPPWVPSY